MNNRPKQQSYHQPSKSSSKLASYLYELEPKESRKEQASRSFVDQAGSLNGVEGKDMYEYVPKFKGTMVREEKVDGGGGGGLLPVSLQNQRSNKPKPMGCNLIDEKLQRIKSKIL